MSQNNSKKQSTMKFNTLLTILQETMKNTGIAIAYNKNTEN